MPGPADDLVAVDREDELALEHVEGIVLGRVGMLGRAIAMRLDRDHGEVEARCVLAPRQELDVADVQALAGPDDDRALPHAAILVDYVISSSRRAIATACVRVAAPSFAIATPSCVRAVSGEMKSSAPDRLVRVAVGEQPQHVALTRCQLHVTPARADERVGERGVDVHAAAATVSSARTRLSSGASLSTKPRAPASSASVSRAPSPKPE